MQGDALLSMAHIVVKKPTLLREFVNYGLGIQDFPIINMYLAHKDADYNAAFQIFKTTDRMWSFFGRYFIISSLGLILAMGEHWLEGLKFFGITTCFLLSRFAWAASHGPPKAKNLLNLSYTQCSNQILKQFQNILDSAIMFENSS